MQSQEHFVTMPNIAAGHPSRLRKRLAQLVMLWLVAIGLSSSASHLLIGWLKIETTTGKPWSVGSINGKPFAFMAGSSLAGDGISWKRVATELDQQIGGWGVAGASPYEMEQFQHKASDSKLSFIVVSVYDLNEASFSDFRADVVPPGHAINELISSRAPWAYSKRVISQYFTSWLRKLFPTVGRSQGVMGELRAKLSSRLGATPQQSEAGPTLSLGETAPDKAYKTGRIADWSQGTIIRKVEAMRTAFQGEQSFTGLKKRAFQRLVQRATPDQRVVVVVLPVSPIYSEKFLTPPVKRAFEESLADVQRGAPAAQWVRLDWLPALSSNTNYWDLVHMNTRGQSIATEALLAALVQNKAR